MNFILRIAITAILRIGVSDALSFDPLPELSRRELFTIPFAVGGAVVYGKLLSDTTQKLIRGDLIYPDAHENRVRSTITETVLASFPQVQSDNKNGATKEGIGRSLRILEIGIGKNCRVIRRGLYNDAFEALSSRGVADVDLIGVDIVSPTSEALEKAKDVLRSKRGSDGVDISFEFVKNSLTSRLDFEDGYFDCVLCTLTLCSVDDQIAALREIKRVLRNNGGSFGYIEHVAVNPDEPYRLLEYQQIAFDGLQQIVADNCHLHRYTEDNIYNVFGVSDGTGHSITKERFLVDDMWPISCQTRGVIKLA